VDCRGKHTAPAMGRWKEGEKKMAITFVGPNRKKAMPISLSDARETLLGVEKGGGKDRLTPF